MNRETFSRSFFDSSFSTNISKFLISATAIYIPQLLCRKLFMNRSSLMLRSGSTYFSSTPANTSQILPK